VSITIDQFKALGEQYYGLRKLFAEVANVPENVIPFEWIYLCRNQEIAQAVTLRNATHVMMVKTVRPRVKSIARPWHSTFQGKTVEMLQSLANEGYLEGIFQKAG